MEKLQNHKDESNEVTNHPFKIPGPEHAVKGRVKDIKLSINYISERDVSFSSQVLGRGGQGIVV